MQRVRRMKPLARMALDDLSEGTQLSAEGALQLLREALRAMTPDERDRFVAALKDGALADFDADDPDDPDDDRNRRAADRRRLATDQRYGRDGFAERYPGAAKIRLL